MAQKKISTIWPIQNHTIAKHEILKEYLKAWIPILGRTAEQIIFLDGFAGPGIYTGGQEGSPIIAIQTALDSNSIKSIKNIHFHFIEKDEMRYKKLNSIIEEKFPDLPSNINIDTISGDFIQRLTTFLDQIEKNGTDLPPTLAFLDPFGYSEVSFKLITRLLKYPRCELLFTFMYGFVNRFLDKDHENAVDKLYGTKSWREAREISNTDDRLTFLLNLYVTQLKNTGMKFVRTFTMMDSDKKIIYDLIFATKHWKGMDEMKKSMLKIVNSGTYTFSDRIDTNQTYFINQNDDESWIDDASKLIFERFSGKEINLEEIKIFVLADTPFRFLKKILMQMEKNGKIISVTKRNNNKLTYDDNCMIEFV